jgi:hypothetical protein
LKQLIAAIMSVILAACASLQGPSGGSNAATAQDEAAVAAQVERMRVAMIDPTTEALGAVVADSLSYGHSGGKVDTKASFIADLMSGASDFVTLALTDQTIRMVDPGLAIVRHTLTAQTNDSGKPGKVALKVLGVWQKQAGQWRLVARQAVRLPS